MNLIVNGQPASFSFESGTVLDLLRAYSLEQKMVVVEVDGSIVPKPDWAATQLVNGQRIELVHFVGGG